VFVSISCTESQILKDGKAASVVVTLTLTDCETGESTTAQCPGYAEEPKSDKSLWKAVTGACKYVIRSFFCLATTDDPEQDDQERMSSKPSTVKPGRSVTASTPGSVNHLQSVPSEPAPNKPVTSNEGSSTTLEQTSLEMERIGWTAIEGRQFLEQTFGKRGRKELTAAELHQFLSHLLELPSMSARAPAAMAS